MARSSYVYVATDQGVPVCTATVKYEFVIWLEKLSAYDRSLLDLWRCHDGTWGAQGYSGNGRKQLELEDFGL